MGVVFTDFSGQIINGKKVLAYRGLLDGERRWEWQCTKCGYIHEQGSTTHNLRRNGCRNCSGKKHGHRSNNKSSLTYKSWSNAIARCYNPKHKSYKNYGQRGIVMCDEWRNSFEAFLKDMGERPPGYSLERLDVTKGYFKENCIWLSEADQAANKQNTLYVEWRGARRKLIDLVRERGLNYSTAYSRFKKGWSISRVLGY